MGTFSRETIDPWWVTGFSDGESSFTFSRSSRQIAMYYTVKLPVGDEPILVRLQGYFGAGKVYEVKSSSRSGSTRTASMYRVTRIDELKKIVAHFDQFPLQSQKRKSYEIWKGMVAIKAHYRNPDRAALEVLALQLSESSPRNQSWR